jgi:class 3 adenylate cyclase
VQRFGGFVAKYMGDGVLVYFGYPQAHEDDAERATRAGLELIQAVGGLKSSTSLQTRVGIAIEPQAPVVVCRTVSASLGLAAACRPRRVRLAACSHHAETARTASG